MEKSILDVITNRMAERALKAKERLREKILAAGYNPEAVIIGEKTWWDYDTETLRYECFVANKDIPEHLSERDDG